MDGDYLVFGESGLFHIKTPAGGILDFHVAQVSEGTSRAAVAAIKLSPFGLAL